MKRSLALCALLTCGLLMGCASQSQATTPKATAPKRALTTRDTTPGMSPEFQTMMEVGQLSGADRDRFVAKVQERHELYQKRWTNTSDGRKQADLQEELTKARAAKDTQKAEQLNAKLAELAQKDNQIRRELRPMVVTALPPQAQKDWAVYEINRRVVRGLGVRLTPEQRPQAEQIVRDEVTKALKADTLANDSYLSDLEAAVRPTITTRIIDKVLTAEQRQAREEKPATKPVINNKKK